MPDLESFGGFDSADQYDPAAFERFKERIKAAAAHIKALKKSEQKAREQEDKLIKILLKFVKDNKKKDIMLLIARLLEQNIPPIFILSVVVLGNEDIKKDVDEQKLLEKGSGKAEAGADKKVNGRKEMRVEDVTGEITSQMLEEPQIGKALTFFGEDQTLSLKMRIEIDEWMKGILESALKNPHRVINTVFDHEENLKLPLVQLATFTMRDYMEEKQQKPEYEKLKEFSSFFLYGIMKNVMEYIEKQKQLNESPEEV